MKIEKTVIAQDECWKGFFAAKCKFFGGLSKKCYYCFIVIIVIHAFFSYNLHWTEIQTKFC